MPSGTSAIRRRRTDFLEQFAEPLDGVCSDRWPSAVRRRVRAGTSQYSLDRDRAVLEDQRVAGQQAVNALEERLRARHVARAEHLGQHAFVGLGADQAALEDRLDLRSEQQPVAGRRPVERLDAEAIAHEQQPAARRVPDREREHAAQVLDAAVAPLFVGVDDGLGVRPGAIAMAGASRLAADLGVVVDLAVEDDPDRAVFVRRAAAARRRDRRCSAADGRGRRARRRISPASSGPRWVMTSRIRGRRATSSAVQSVSCDDSRNSAHVFREPFRRTSVLRPSPWRRRCR